MMILTQYERLVEDVRNACKSLGWKLEVKQDIDEMLYLVLDDCDYFVAPSMVHREDKPAYYLGAMVPNHGTRWEPPSCDDVTVSKQDQERPESHLSALLDAHFQIRKDWAMQATLTYGE
jgi:hypothetical protein